MSRSPAILNAFCGCCRASATTTAVSTSGFFNSFSIHESISFLACNGTQRQPAGHRFGEYCKIRRNADSRFGRDHHFGQIHSADDFTHRIPMTTMNLSKFTPYPGSPVYRELYGTNIKDDHWEKMNGMNFLWSPEGIEVDELDREYQNILVSFYRQHRVMHKYLLMSLQNPTHLVRLGKFLAGFLSAKLRSYFQGRKGVLLKETNEL